MAKTAITVAKGDGIGPEIMDATLAILEAGGAELKIHEIEVGEKIYLKGEKTGIAPEAWNTIRNTKAFLKAPITTPQGGGFKSLNVTIRTTLGLYANVRPSVSYSPYVRTKHPGMDVVIVRENEEDLYCGIEYQQTANVVHALKVISRPGSERIVRYAFEYARANHRKKVTCFTKDNILKMSDGLFHHLFEEIGKEYPDIEKEHWIVDIGAAKLADKPESFDVIVLPNLYGDILSDVAAQIAGSVGMAGSANIGEHAAMFEAIHGSAPRHAGANSANPSGLLHGAILMLVHIGQPEAAARIHNAWLVTLEDGLHTYDIHKEGVSKKKVGTKEFAQAVIDRLGKLPKTLPIAEYEVNKKLSKPAPAQMTHAAKGLAGVDVYIDSKENAEALAKKLQTIPSDPLKLQFIGNRGVKVWPGGHPETLSVDSWRCRFTGKAVTHEQIATLLQNLAKKGIDFTQTSLLQTFDGKPGYLLSQDEQ